METTKINVNKIYIITDTHFGARSNSVEYLDMMIDYFENSFIPSVENTIEPNDILIHCGDVFDNRQSINLGVLSKTISLFHKLSNLFKNGIYIIAGNHDVMKKNSNDISSLDSLKFIPNVNVYKEPHVLDIGNKKMLMLPWVHEHSKEKEIILNSDCQLVYCHTNFIGCSFDKYRKIEEGLDAKDFRNVERIFCGHIHWGQQKGKVNILGTQYQINRGDSENRKGYWILDPHKVKETFVENDYSPKFKRLYIHDIMELTISDIKSSIMNSRLDLMIPIGFSYDLNEFIEILREYCYTVTIIPYDENVNQSVVDVTATMDLKEYFKELIDMKSLNSNERNRMMNKFEDLYKKYV